MYFGLSIRGLECYQLINADQVVVSVNIYEIATATWGNYLIRAKALLL